MAGRRACAAIAAAVAIGIPGVAEAATVHVAFNDVVVGAAAGEENAMTLSATLDGVYEVADAEAPLTAGAGCTQLAPAHVRCTVDPTSENWAHVDLGDLDDRLDATVPGALDARGGAGDDSVDALTTERGYVALDGGAGDDDLIVDAYDIFVQGGDGDDTLRASRGQGTLEGGGGDDAIDASASGAMSIGGGLMFDHPTGGQADGPDAITGSPFDDEIWGGDGNDTIRAGAGGDIVSGDADSDTLAGGAGADRLIGGQRDCRIGGGGWPVDCVSTGDAGGNDAIDAGAGEDRVHAGLGADALDTGDLAADPVVDCGGGTDSLFADPLDEHGGTCEQVERCGPAAPVGDMEDRLRECAAGAREGVPVG